MQELLVKNSTVGIEFNAVIKRVTGRKARDLQMEEIGCVRLFFLISLLSSRKNKLQVSDFFLFAIQN